MQPTLDAAGCNAPGSHSGSVGLCALGVFPSESAPPSVTGRPTGTATATPAPTSTGPGTSPSAPPPDETNPPQAGDRVISSTVTHDNPLPIAPPPEPPLPYLYTIGVGAHPSDAPPYDQMSLRFKGGFPGYELRFVPERGGDASGLPLPLSGTNGVLRVVFNADAQFYTGRSRGPDRPGFARNDKPDGHPGSIGETEHPSDRPPRG